MVGFPESGAVGVLRVTTDLSRGARGLTITLEGELRGPWLAIVRDVCSERGPKSRLLRLDLAAVMTTRPPA
jgi:hypothetical protein